MMRSRDFLLLLVGLIIILFGILGSIFWTMFAGLVSLLLMHFLVLFILVLQRRQVGRLQGRVLELVRANKAASRQNAEAVTEDQTGKKILGLLQAQQVSLDIINNRFEDFSIDAHYPG